MGHGASMDDVHNRSCTDRSDKRCVGNNIPQFLVKAGGGVLIDTRTRQIQMAGEKYSVSREGGLLYQNQRSAICAEAA